MPSLLFPYDCVGTLRWPGSWDDRRGPVLAQGPLYVPDDVPVALTVMSVSGVRRSRSKGWILKGDGRPVDLSFIRHLPPDAIDTLTIKAVQPESMAALPHLAPGLHRLYLAHTDLTDDALRYVARLTWLVYLQTFGNRFTDQGVALLGNLAFLESLYLEERTLSAGAFTFTYGLPRLTQLGLMEVPISGGQLERLRATLPHVRIST